MLARIAQLHLVAQAQPLLRAALAAAAVRMAPAAARTLQARGCMTHHRLWAQPDQGAAADPALRAAAAALHMGPSPAAHHHAALPVLHSEDNTAACGEPPASPYARPYGGLWQHGEAASIVCSDEHSSVTNELEKLLQVADEAGGPDALFQVFEEFGGGAGWSEMNVATAFRCLARDAARMSPHAVEAQILRHPAFARLVDAASQHAAEMSDAELAEVASACTKLRYQDSLLAEQVRWLELNNCGALEAYSSPATAECMAGAV